MYTSTIDLVDSVVRPLNVMLDKFSDHVRNNAIRAGVVAAGKPMAAKFSQLAERFVGSKPPTRRLRGTNIEVSRPHLKDSIKTKVWRIPDGTGFINFIGPMAIEVPHAKWFGIKAPTNRHTKAGRYTGTHLSHKGGPANMLQRAFEGSIHEATAAFTQTVKSKIESFKG